MMREQIDIGSFLHGLHLSLYHIQTLIIALNEQEPALGRDTSASREVAAIASIEHYFEMLFGPLAGEEDCCISLAA